MPDPRGRQQVEHPVEDAVPGAQDRNQAQLFAGEQREGAAFERRLDVDSLERQLARRLIGQQQADLEQYAPAFAANDIDAEVLPDLTADDLIGLGMTSIGHRRKLLAAIAALRGGMPQRVTETAPVAAATSGDAERRQLTVMFCDLV